MAKKYFIVFVFILLGGKYSAQKLIFEEYPEKILQPPKFGIKGKHFLHLFYEENLLFGPRYADTLNSTDIRSWAHNTGWRYKLKLSKKICFVSDISYRFKSVFIKQKGNRFPDTLNYKKEKLNFNQVCIAPAFRFIYGSRKNYFGKYIDFGATLAWNFSTVHYTKQILHPTNADFSTQVIRTRQKHLNYTQAFEIDPFISFGFELIQFKFQYRVSDCFKRYRDKKLAELPRFMIGISLSIVNS